MSDVISVVIPNQFFFPKPLNITLTEDTVSMFCIFFFYIYQDSNNKKNSIAVANSVNY
jgi:hypothetical protein